MTISTDVFKAAMGQLASGVTVVTMRSGEQDHGFTATSFTSLSLDPMLVLVCVVNGQRGQAMIEQARHFAVNILSADQKPLGGRFADPTATDRFTGLDFTRATTGAPILPGNLAWVDCRLHSTMPGGDHTIFVGEVVAGEAPGTGDPLLYYNRSWGGFSAS